MLEMEDRLSQICKALSFAAQKHTRQRRKDTEASPYINHPICLLDTLVNEGHVDDTTVLCAAILHDTIEDTQTTHDELVRQFGQKIADVVAEVSDDKHLPKNERKQLQIERAPYLSDAAKMVALADKICNLRDMANSSPSGWSGERVAAYYDWAKRVVDGLRGIHPGLEAIVDALIAGRE